VVATKKVTITLPVDVVDRVTALAGEAGLPVSGLRFLRAERMLVVPSPVLTQSWRGGARQASLARVLRACLIEPTSEVIARNAGVLLGRSRTSDAVDAVVATAINHGALIVTSDPDDLNLLWESAGTATKPAVIQL
jgi:hypothetical protein